MQLGEHSRIATAQRGEQSFFGNLRGLRVVIEIRCDGVAADRIGRLGSATRTTTALDPQRSLTVTLFHSFLYGSHGRLLSGDLNDIFRFNSAAARATFGV